MSYVKCYESSGYGLHKINSIIIGKCTYLERSFHCVRRELLLG